jgi:hypothetical protein
MTLLPTILYPFMLLAATCVVTLPFFLQGEICKVLIVRPVEHADVSSCVNLRVTSLGSLVIGRPPPYPGYISASEESIHNDIDNNPHVHHLKVIDPDNESEVMAYAKWEVYEHGRPDLENLRQPMKQSDKEVDSYGKLREAAHEYFCRRNGDMGPHPHLRKFPSKLSNMHWAFFLIICSPSSSSYSQ